jgi:hypothetical protein
MGALATPTVRAARRAALTAALAAALACFLGGCGYRELKAPCGPEEGTPPALSYAPSLFVPTTGSPLDRLSVYGGMGGGIPVADHCGPLRPINGNLPLGGPQP